MRDWAPDAVRPDDAALSEVAEALSGVLLARGWRVATAESCTGGWIAKVLTDLPGSSRWFEGGAVTYSNAEKTRALGVDQALLESAGAVSEPVVAAMAAGVCSRTGAEAGIAVSGVAGPDGGTADKPVGLVWFAWSVAGHVTAARQLFPGDREAVRRQTVAHAINGLIEALKAVD